MTPNQLFAKYPYQFKKALKHPDMLLVYRGWWPGVVRMCAAIDQTLGNDKQSFRWLQMKEKFGSARYYWTMKGGGALHLDVFSPEADVVQLVLEPKRINDMYEKVAHLVNAEMARTREQCIVCGAPAEIDTYAWHLALCSTHLAERRRGSKHRYWLELDEDVPV
jgi:hypothetical protein